MSTKGKTLLIKMAWRNLFRQRRRTIITLFAMVIGLGLCIPLYGLMEGLKADMIRGITRIHMGEIQIHNPKYPLNRQLHETMTLDGLLERIDKMDNVLATAPRVYTGGLISSEISQSVLLKPATVQKKAGQLRRGRWLVSGDRCAGVVSDKLAELWHLEPGSMLRLKPLPPEGACEKLEVTGILRDGATKPSIWVPMETALRIFTPRNGGKPADEDDIDALPKLDAPASPSATGNNPEVGPAPRVVQPPPLATLMEGMPWTLVRGASNPVGIVAIDPTRERQVTLMAEKLHKGKYLRPTYTRNRDKEHVSKEIVIGELLAKRLLVKVGDVVGLDLMTAQEYPLDDLFRVVGTYKTGVDAMDRSLVYVHIGNAWDKDLMALVGPKGGRAIHEIALRLKRSDRAAATVVALRSALGKGYLVRPWQEVDPTMAKILSLQDAMIAVLLGIIFMVASLGTLNTMLMAVYERTKEFGVLKSVGMGPVRVALLILMETGLLTLMAAIIGAGMGMALNNYLVVHGLDLRAFNPAGFTYQGVFIDPVWRSIHSLKVLLLPTILLCGVSVLVAVWPAVRAGRIRPIEALRQQG